MKNIKNITSLNNEKIKLYTNLFNKKIREKEKKFIIEGFHLVEEASKTNNLECIITSDKNSINNYQNIVKYYVSDEIIKKMTSTKNPQKIIGVVKMLDHSLDKLMEILKQSSVKLVLLDEINDPGNLGTIIRTTAALGYDGIVIGNNCVDLYNEKVIRSTQGILFKIPIIKSELKKAISILKEANISCYGTSLNHAIDLNCVNKNNRFALCVGNEARGVSKDILSLMDLNIKIKMEKDVESLNVAIALGIMLYELK